MALWSNRGHHAARVPEWSAFRVYGGMWIGGRRRRSVPLPPPKSQNQNPSGRLTVPVFVFFEVRSGSKSVGCGSVHL